jgi:lipid-A-disaccharide synthase
MEAAGCRILYPLCRLAVMWFLRVLAHAPTFLQLLSRADRCFRHQRPDAVVLIDYPGFNWWLARRAHFHGIPVFYFVPPQLWGWGGWRVDKMRRWVDHVLCTLPFEESWYRERGIQAHYVGHPYFDELPRQELDQPFLRSQRELGGNLVAILPGSRTQEIERNLGSQIRAARLVHQARTDTRFLVACFRGDHRIRIDDYLRRHPGLPIETHVGRTPEIIELSKACLAVSGSVALELLFRRKPSVIVYRIGKLDLRVARYFMTTKHICLVNLLAGEELYPEFLTDHCSAQAMAEPITAWLADPSAHAAITRKLNALCARVAAAGACAEAALYIVREMRQSTDRRPQTHKPDARPRGDAA